MGGSRRLAAWILTLAVTYCVPASAITIQVEFESGVLFTSASDPTAKAAINAAAADLSAAITSTLGAVNNDVIANTVGQTTATFNFNAHYQNPATGAQIQVHDATVPANTVKMFVSVANLIGGALGQGGPAFGYQLSGSSSGGNLAANWPAALTNAANIAEVAYTRGGQGPIIGTFSGGATLGEVPATFTMDYGVGFGNLWFDVDTNNNGARDTDVALENFWHFNHTTAVAAGKNDLYSVALHEMIHALGVGTSNSWDDDTSGTTWTGSNVIALTGSGANMVTADGNHVASGKLSQRITDGATQEVVMDPSITQGTRKSLTWLDLAFLRDIGFQTVTTAPPDYDGDGDVDAADLAHWNTWYGVNANGDTDGDGDTDGVDFLKWQRLYTGPLLIPASTSVPEPTAFALSVLAALWSLRRRK